MRRPPKATQKSSVTSAGGEPGRLEIAHVLFTDIVGYSKLPMDKQTVALQRLNRLIRDNSEFRRAEAADRLIRLPVGDGIALVFFGDAESALHCARELSLSLRAALDLKLRMGVHTGPVYRVADINTHMNVAGDGINMAQRVMDCGDAGHILVSDTVANVLGSLRTWAGQLHGLGEAEVKHGVRVHIFNVYADGYGNAVMPEKLRLARTPTAHSAPPAQQPAAQGPATSGERGTNSNGDACPADGDEAACPVRSAAHDANKAGWRTLLSRRGLPPLLAALMLLFAVAWYAKLFRSAPVAAPHYEIKSLAVLPLDNLSGDSSQDYFADGMTEALSTNLAKIGAVRVISRPSVMHYRATNKSIQEIARELNVDAIIRGSVQRSGESVLITVQLIHAATEKHLWADSYERDVRDILKLQSEVARAVAREIQIELTPHEQTQLANVGTVNPKAYDYFLLGKFYAARQNIEDNETAIQVLEKATSTDPTYAAAFSELARAYNTKSYFFKPQQKQWREKAFICVEKALALSPDLAEAHLARGLLLWTPSEQFPHEETIRAYKRALTLNPNLYEAYYELGVVYYHVGLLDQAHVELQKAAAINPANRLARFRMGTSSVYMGKYEQALNIFKSIPKDINPVSWSYHTSLALFHLGKKDEALAVIEDFLRDYPHDEGGIVISVRALLFADAGKHSEAEAIIASIATKGRDFGHFHHIAYTIASAYALMNKPERAVHWLRIAADDGFPCYPLFERDPNLNSIRQNPEFIELMARVRGQWERYRSLESGKNRVLANEGVG